MFNEEGLEYAQLLSRLIEVCAFTSPGSAERERAARDLENKSRRTALALEIDGEELRIEGCESVSFESVGTERLVAAMLGHQVARLSIRQLTPARELVEVARLLSLPLGDAEGGAAIESYAASLRLWNVDFVGIASLDAEPVIATLPPEMLFSLRAGADYAHAESALAKLATRGEQALEESDARTIGAILVAMDEFERDGHHESLRHPCDLAMRRLLTPMALRLTAQLIPAARRRESLLAVLSRDADAGAEALFAHLVAAQDMRERRAFFDSLLTLRAGFPMLMAALNDPQWYVARNAAELLGEMRIEGVEVSLSMMLRSEDERRRIAAASALARLRSPLALEMLHEATNDESPQVRYFANSSLIARIEGASARQLTAALEQDGDPEMKLQIISALGRLGTADAVQKLIKSLVSGPSRRDPAHMTSEYRCASIEAVAKARGVKAFTLISQFRSDRDERVRATAQRVCERLAS